MLYTDIQHNKSEKVYFEFYVLKFCNRVSDVKWIKLLTVLIVCSMLTFSNL